MGRHPCFLVDVAMGIYPEPAFVDVELIRLIGFVEDIVASEQRKKLLLVDSFDVQDARNVLKVA